MAHVFSLMIGSTALDLTSGSYRLAQYTPRTGKNGEVSETVTIRVSGSSATGLRDNVIAIERLLAQAAERQKNPVGDRIYIKLQPSGYTLPLTSEILDGYVYLPDSTLKADWASLEIEVALIWTRRDYWEEASATLLISNTNGLDQSALTIFNCNDGATVTGGVRVNTIDIDGSAIGGDLPAPVGITLLNQSSATDITRVWISSNHRSYSGGYLPSHKYEAEAGGSYGTDTASSDASDGWYRSFTLNSNSETEMTKWNFAAVDLERSQGNWFHVLVRFMSVTDIQNVRFRLKLAVDEMVNYSNPMQPATANPIQELGMIQIPPGVVNLETFGSGYFSLLGTRMVASDQTIEWDYMQLTPADGFRILQPANGGPLKNGYTLYDVPAISELPPYVREGTYFRSTWAGLGDPIMLYPGRDTRMYFNVMTATDAPIHTKMQVALSYAPRRRTL